MNNNPKLYCGTYGKYNSGSIVGNWMDLSEYESAEEFFQACAELHEDEHDPEFMFQDYECFPRSMYSESMSKEDVETLIELAQLEDDEREYIGEYLDEVDSKASFDEARERYNGNINDLRSGTFMTDEEAYGYECMEEGLIEIPDHLVNYFDFERYGRDMLEDMHVTDSGHIFRNY